jgi:hypothetical protein
MKTREVSLSYFAPFSSRLIYNSRDFNAPQSYQINKHPAQLEFWDYIEWIVSEERSTSGFT